METISFNLDASEVMALLAGPLPAIAPGEAANGVLELLGRRGQALETESHEEDGRVTIKLRPSARLLELYGRMGQLTLLPGDQWEIQLNGDTVVLGIAARDGWRWWIGVPLGDFLKFLATFDNSICVVADPVKGATV